MTDGRVIVTGADAGYFRYLIRALHSVRAHEEGRRIALAVLDLGLTGAQRAEAAALADQIVEPGWDYDLPDRKTLPSHWRAYTARPHLPGHVPDYDLHMWLDADAWVQQWDCIERLFAGAAGGSVAIVPEVHPSYRNQHHARTEFETVIRAAFADSFGEETAERLYRQPHLNTGVFALRADAPHWHAWSAALGRALLERRSRERLAEQCAMNVVVYEEGLPATFLEPRCNWICHHAAPRRDDATGLLTEPTAPFAPLGIVHETMWSKGAV